MLGAVRPTARCYISSSRRHLKHGWVNIGSLRLNRVQKHFQWFPREVEYQGGSRMLKMQNRKKNENNSICLKSYPMSVSESSSRAK